MARTAASLRLSPELVACAALAAFLASQAANPAPAHAAAARERWTTILTPRFRIHYHEGTEALARRVAAMAEVALERLSHLLGHVPEDAIHVVLTDETDATNGFAQAIPQNTITLFAGIPEPFGALGDYDDFMWLLLVHELAHVVHLDTIGGASRYVNAFLGKTLSPNQVQPRWFIEGLAVYVESKVTSGGRNRSALVDMFVREQVLAERFPSLDEISTLTRRFPGSAFPWNLGGRFLEFIAERHGEGALAAISHEYGARTIPYGLNIVARHATGKSFVELWEEWKESEVKKAIDLLERVRAEGGAREGERIDRPRGEIYHPRFSRTGRLAFLEVPRDGDGELVFLEPDRTTEILRVRTSRGVGAFTPDGRRFVASVVDTHARRFSYSDLEIIDLSTGRRTRRTSGARIDAPDVSPDGDTIVAVQQNAGQSWLVTLSLEGTDAPAAFAVPPEGCEVSAPRWSPDGRSVAASLHTADGGRRIVTFDATTGRRRDLTRTRAQDLDPVYSRDGRAIFFSSDRGGVFNIHRVDVATGRIARVTNVLTGAFEPAVDAVEGTLLFVHGIFDGFELNFIEGEAASVGPDGLAVHPYASRPEPAAWERPTAFPEERYASWETLLPRAYLPTSGFDGLGDTLGLLVAGTDAVGAHTYQLRFEYGLESKRVGYALSYGNRMLATPVFVSSSLTATSRPGRFAPSARVEDRPESIWRLRVGVEYPLGRWDVGHGLSFSYGVELRRGVNLFSRDPFQEAPLALGDLTLASVSAAWNLSTVRSFADSISPAGGYALDLVLDVHDPRIGSDLRVLTISSHFTRYFTLPWLRHHVLALRLALGGGAGDARGRSIYVLGGLSVRDILSDTIDGVRVGADVIRGYEVAAFRGNAFYIGTAEYRFPLFDVARGVDTLPFFLDRLYGAVFVDAGDAPDRALDLANAKVGLGLEGRLDLVLGYFLPITARLGFARGVSEGGIDNVYLVLGGLF